MKLQVLQENLSKALAICSRFTSSRVQLPVLANILFKTKKNKLLIAGTNLELSILLSVGAKIEEEGEITVPGRIITEIVSNLGLGQIKLHTDKELLKIITSGFESTVSGMNAADFPQIPESVGLELLQISSSELVSALPSVLFAVSNDETRPVLTGVLVIIEKNNLVLVATDGFRLSQKKIKIEEVKEEKKIIIPKNALAEVLRLVKDEDFVSFSFKKAENQVLFGLADAVLTSRVIEGEFPDFERIIPKESKVKINLDKEEFLRAVKLASVFARDSANVVKLSIKENFLEVYAESSQSGNQKTVVDAKVEKNAKEDFLIAFNFRFLEELLGVIKGDEVLMEFSETNAPALFLDPKDSNFLHIIMPVRLQT